MAKLRVIQGTDQVKELPLKATTSVGRRPDSDICVNSSLVSRDHCVIFENRGSWLVKDLGSTNGTYVNGELARETVLRPGDELTIGPLTFAVEYEAMAAPPEQAAEPPAEPAPTVAQEPPTAPPESEAIPLVVEPEAAEAAAVMEPKAEPASQAEPASPNPVSPPAFKSRLRKRPARVGGDAASGDADNELDSFLARFEDE